MQFAPDGSSFPLEVIWYFTDKNAKWCGLENIFNSRNWYGGVSPWPDIGEVEGAPRPWRDGSVCPGQLADGPHGTAEEWAEGSYTRVSPALCSCVCDCQITATEQGGLLNRGPFVLPWTAEGPFFAIQDPFDGRAWWTDLVGPPCVELGPGMDLALTDGPPTFNVIGGPVRLLSVVDHSLGTWQVDNHSAFFPDLVVQVAS